MVDTVQGDDAELTVRSSPHADDARADDGPDPFGPPSARGEPAAIGGLLHALGSHMHAVGARFAAREQLHPTDVQALSILALHGGRLTAGELARGLELSSGATTRLVDRLEAVGHVARTPDEVDRRRRYVAITPDASDTARAFFGQLSQMVADVLADYDEGERTTIQRFLEDLVRAMDGPTGP